LPQVRRVGEAFQWATCLLLTDSIANEIAWSVHNLDSGKGRGDYLVKVGSSKEGGKRSACMETQTMVELS